MAAASSESALRARSDAAPPMFLVAAGGPTQDPGPTHMAHINMSLSAVRRRLRAVFTVRCPGNHNISKQQILVQVVCHMGTTKRAARLLK